MVRKMILSGLAIVVMMVVALAIGAFTGGAEPEAEAAEPTEVEEEQDLFLTISDEDLAARIETARAEESARLTRQTADIAAQEPVGDAEQRRPVQKVRRWVWESPAETRAAIWNIPEADSETGAVTGLLRICISEADGHERDCIAIWQVLNNIRSSKCDRGRIRRITECDSDGETLISVMRRAQRVAMGVIPAPSRRSQWISELTTSCDRPETYGYDERHWEQQYRRTCEDTVALARRLVSGEYVAPVIRGVRPITWGGRCEDAGGACDDPLACARGLARIPNTDTANAFWCRPGSRGCSAGIDPVCRQLGFRDREQAAIDRTSSEPSG
jgi:hypothetical protein